MSPRILSFVAVILSVVVGCRSDSPAAVATPPVLTAVSPTSAVQGTTQLVTLTGTNFSASGNTPLSVSGGGITVASLHVTSSTSATVSVTVAADAPLGVRTLSFATTAGQASGAPTFTILPAPPTLTGVSTATAVEGTTISETLTGTNFVTGASTVAVSGTGVTVSNVSVTNATTLTMSLAVDSVAELGARQMTVTTPGGVTAAQTVTINPRLPALSKIDPSSGLIGTTVRVTLTGTSFVPGATTMTVSGTGVTVSNVSVGSLLDRVVDQVISSVQTLIGTSTAAAVAGTGTTLSATLVIATDAALGPRNVTVTTAGGTSTALVFTVNAPTPVIGAFSATPSAVDLGQASKLAWSSIANAASCSIDNGVGTVSCADGSAAVTPKTATTYTLTATGAGGSATATAKITLNGPSIITFSANPTSIVSGNSATLSWAGINNETSCIITPAVGAVSCGDGSVTVSPPVTTAYEMTITGPAGSITANATVSVTPAPPAIATFVASPAAITVGNSAALTWTGITHATTCSIDNGVGNVTCADGTANVTPTVGTTYTMTATGTGGTVTKTAVVTVGPTLTSVAPVAGVQGTTVSATLAGTNFISGATSVAVSGAGVTVSNINVTSATSLTADFVIAAGAAATARNVTVTAGGQTSAAQTFTVNVPAPTLASLAPNQGAQGGSQTVTFTGTNFQAGTTLVGVAVGGGITVSSVNVTSATQLTATFAVAAGAALGGHTVNVMTAGGTSSSQTFTVVAPPSINAFNALATHLTAAQPSRLRWTTSNAATCSIDNGVGALTSCNDSLFVTPGTTKTYTLSATGNGATVTATFQLFANEAGRFVYWTTQGGGAGTHVHQFALDATTGDLTQIGTGTVASGTTPHGIAVDPSGNYAYVANTGSNNVSMYTISRLDGSLTQQGVIGAGSGPIELAVDPTGRFAYVINNNSGGTGSISQYTIGGTGLLTSNGTTTLGTNSTGIAIDPTGRFLYASNRNGKTIQEFSINPDGTLSSLGTLATSGGFFAQYLAIDPTGRFLYLTHDTDGRYSQYSIGANGTLALLGGGPVNIGSGTERPIAVDPTGRFAYIFDYNNAIAHEFSIDQTTGILTRFAAPTLTHFGAGDAQTVQYIAIDPQGKFMYGTDNNHELIIIFSIDGSGVLSPVSAPLRTIASGTSPWGIVVSP